MTDSELRRDPYLILQVSPDAELEVIEAAYRSLARKYHPDLNPNPTAREKMQELNWAHDILADPLKRRDWNSQATQRRQSQTNRPKDSDHKNPPPPPPPPPSPPASQQPTTISRGGSLPAPIVFMVIFVGLILLVAVAANSNQVVAVPTSTSFILAAATSIPPTRTQLPATEVPTKTPTKRPTLVSQNPLRSQGCVRWDEIRSWHVGRKMCVFGIVSSVQTKQTPYTIQFSTDWNDFKVQDWNYSYIGIEKGACIKVEGEVKDNVSFLIIIPTDIYEVYDERACR